MLAWRRIGCALRHNSQTGRYVERSLAGHERRKAVRESLIAQGHHYIVVSQFKCAQSREACAHCLFGAANEREGVILRLETVVADRDAADVAHAIFAASYRRDIPDYLDRECPLAGVFSIGISKVGEKADQRPRASV